MNVIVLGGTKGMGRSVARRLAERGDRVFLLGRDPADLEASNADLRARAGERGTTAEGDHAHCDLADHATLQPALSAAREALGKVDCVVVTAAMFASQDALEADTDLARRLLVANLANTIAFCEYARKDALQGRGTLCVFSSVAGDRGRKPVGIYGASKAGLSHYLDALDHKHRAEGLVTICVKPGFVRTGMTAGLKPPPFAGEPEAVATDVVRAIDRGTPLIYTPAIWRLVMLAIRHLPRFVMRKIAF
ncbi:MAG: SDR family NAD(P)-dependent oxidoreductase [Myxococcales bacterium]|nr:SDR family NAD(P)-dependent oxidoreductase [Myxococcales bacterium]